MWTLSTPPTPRSEHAIHDWIVSGCSLKFGAWGFGAWVSKAKPATPADFALPSTFKIRKFHINSSPSAPKIHRCYFLRRLADFFRYSVEGANLDPGTLKFLPEGRWGLAQMFGPLLP